MRLLLFVKWSLRYWKRSNCRFMNTDTHMKKLSIHHIEIGVQNGEECHKKLARQYGLSLVATRENDFLKQWVLKSGTATILLTQLTGGTGSQSLEKDPYYVPSNLFSSCKYPRGTIESTPNVVDTVYNIAFDVRNIDSCLNRLAKADATLLKPVKILEDSDGKVKIATVKSCVGNVVHTLVESDGYMGTFLPGFTSENAATDCVNSDMISHFDHVTFACNCGDSVDVQNWYEKSFGMRRFFINRDEDEKEGFVINSADIGLRLKAFEYWKCAETGFYSVDSSKHSIKFVIAEALPNQGPNQVDTFLHEHGGPGVQHIGLHTPNIVHAVSTLKERGVDFAEPPYTYYTQVGKLQEICDVGEDLTVLEENGILIDAEADPEDRGNNSEGTKIDNSSLVIRYLMQKFTKPIFDRNTFFLEIIQRVGARGFGSGNVTALWRSVQAYMNNKDDLTKSSS
ncbi:hypothetical protein ACJMK2_005989 [Sinanodonta woodiana]|uniref:VOC domain-containing protein n=1 Tax=Sinanodonta woodiana TaxID=1069815 RepID=A0ABD3VVA3_SINWO